MEDRLVIIDADSITPALVVARDLPGAGTWVFDPTVLDRAIDAGLPNVVLVCPRPATDHPTLLGWARAQAFAIESELDRLLQAIAPTTSILGWQHQNLQYQLAASRWYTELWDDQRTVFEGTRPHLFLCDNPAHYYWPSFGPGLLLAHRLRVDAIAFKAYTYGARNDLSRCVPRLFDEPGGSEQFDLLSHLPTAFYDKGYYLDEVRASGRRTINLQARIWNVDFPVHADVPVADAEEARGLLGATELDRIDTFHAVSAQHLEAWLAARIPSPEHRRRQALHIAEGYRSQLITLALLERRFARRRPHRVLITDHDAGFHGPILSFAASHGIPVVMVPHSKTTADLDFPAKHVTCLTHPMQADAMSDATGLRVRHHVLAFPETFSADSSPVGAIRKVGLLLNGLAINGMQFTQFAAFIDGIRHIGDWCRGRGLPLRIRSRPGQVMTTLIAEASGLDPRDIISAMNESIVDFAQSIDICLMYDAPTSASLEFMKRGVAILNPLPEPLGKAEAIAANTEVIPREDIGATMARLDDLVNDPLRFSDFRRQQFIAYVRLFAQARPLRDFL